MSHKLISQEDITNFPTPIKAIFEIFHKRWEDDQVLETSQDVENFEQTVFELTAQLQTVVVEHKTRSRWIPNRLLPKVESYQKNLPCKVINKGFRDVVITTKCGICILVHTLYYMAISEKFHSIAWSTF